MSLEDLRSGARAPPTTADQRDLQHVVPRGVDATSQTLVSNQRRRGGNGRRQETANFLECSAAQNNGVNSVDEVTPAHVQIVWIGGRLQPVQSIVLI